VIYHNAVVHPVAPGQQGTDAFVIKDKIFVGVGKFELIRRVFRGAKRIDLKGACVVPGLIDAHGHLATLGALQRQIDLRDTTSYQQMIDRTKQYAAKRKPGSWILGGRWDQANWGQKELPTHPALSAATPDHPVLLSRIDGHAALANQAALELAGITRDTQPPPGGEIGKDQDGELTGMLIDNAIDLVRGQIPQGGGEPILELWKTAQTACFRAGLTAVHDAGVARKDLPALKRAYETGELKIRAYVMLSDSRGMAGWLKTNKPYQSARLTIRALKLYLDGAMGSRGAWMLEPYSDRPASKGLNVMPTSRLNELATVAAEHGWQVCTHAIGDRANREALDAYQHALKGRKNLRFRIEHAQCIHPTDIPRFKELGIIASMQPTHATSDMRWAEARVGKQRLEGCYAWRTLLQSGARLAFGSDFPVESENPILGIFAAITRQDQKGHPPGGWIPSQKLTRAEALRLFTLDAAYAGFLEKQLGSIEVGKQADFVVLDRDILTVPPTELLRTKVLRTVIAGETVYHQR